jgi:uncharacterized protein YggE
MSINPTKSITVTGTAQGQENNQVAQFTAGVNAIDLDKNKAVTEVNNKMTALVTAVKQFGIDPQDIQTQNSSIYQEQNQKNGQSALGSWQVSNSIQITLRDVTKAQELSDLLSASGANNVYGPNFSVDTTKSDDTTLLSQAIADARKKATGMAKASGASLGKVVQVSEGTSSSQSPIALKSMGMGGSGAPVEPGSTTVEKSVTVTFELK